MRMGMASLPAVHMLKLNCWMDLGKTSRELYAIGGSYVAVSGCEGETTLPVHAVEAYGILEVKFTLKQATRAQRGSRGLDLLFP